MQKTIRIIANGQSIPFTTVATPEEAAKEIAEYIAFEAEQGRVTDGSELTIDADDLAAWDLAEHAKILAQGVDAISNIVSAAYTDKVWKSAEYSAKKGEADYVLSLSKTETIDETKCRLITAEATEKSIDIRTLATVVDGKVKQYEALVLGAGQAEQALEKAIAAAQTQTDKMATKDQIVAGFKKAISGE